jgi:hypothetical protein
MRVDRLSHFGTTWQAAINQLQPPRTAELVWIGGRAGPVIVADVDRLAAMRRGAGDER